MIYHIFFAPSTEHCSEGAGEVLNFAKGNNISNSTVWVKAYVFHLICDKVSHQSPRLLSVCHNLLRSPQFPSFTPLRDHRRTRRLFLKAPAVAQVCPLPWHADCVRSPPPPPSPVSTHLNRQPIISMQPGLCSCASVESWPSQLPEVELPPFPREFTMQYPCVRCELVCMCVCAWVLLLSRLYFFNVFFFFFSPLLSLCRTILKAAASTSDFHSGHASKNYHHFDGSTSSLRFLITWNDHSRPSQWCRCAWICTNLQEKEKENDNQSQFSSSDSHHRQSCCSLILILSVIELLYIEHFTHVDMLP